MHRDDELLEQFSAKAKAGDGQFAIAYALLRVVEAQDRMREDFGFGPYDRKYPGIFEKLAMGMDDLAKAVGEVADNTRTE